MELRSLTSDEATNVRTQVESQLSDWATSGYGNGVPWGAIYPVSWSLSTFDRERAERVAWLLSEMGYTITSLREQTAPGETPGVVDLYFCVDIQRRLLVLPDALVGEALILEALAVNWGASVSGMCINTGKEERAQAWRSMHGPMGKDIC